MAIRKFRQAVRPNRAVALPVVSDKDAAEKELQIALDAALELEMRPPVNDFGEPLIQKTIEDVAPLEHGFPVIDTETLKQMNEEKKRLPREGIAKRGRGRPRKAV